MGISGFDEIEVDRSVVHLGEDAFVVLCDDQVAFLAFASSLDHDTQIVGFILLVWVKV